MSSSSSSSATTEKKKSFSLLKSSKSGGKKTKKTVTIDENNNQHFLPANSDLQASSQITEQTEVVAPLNGNVNGFGATNGMNGNETPENWHMDHFNCWSCDQSLAGGRYVVRDQKQFCIKCFEQQHANVCDECQKPIGIESKDLSYKERHWHEACFICSKCKSSLINKPFGTKSERIYCGDCYDQQFGSRCDKCDEVFRAGQRKLEYRGKEWHDQCFLCNKCQIPIGTKSFVPKDAEIFCSECYESKFATRCVRCCEVILANGIIYRDEPWHKQCFKCNGCSLELAGTSFLVRDEKPYCQACFGNLFSHKCQSCSKPIIGTGNGGTKFITYEERYWHTDCFQCADCKIALEGKGFIKDGPDIICGECAKIKLAAL